MFLDIVGAQDILSAELALPVLMALADGLDSLDWVCVLGILPFQIKIIGLDLLNSGHKRASQVAGTVLASSEVLQG